MIRGAGSRRDWTGAMRRDFVSSMSGQGNSVMFRSLRSATGQIALALAAMLGTLVPSSAEAADVTVGGITYDVVFFQGPATFNDNSATIEAAPWWGSAANALTFANAYAAQVTQ